MQSSDILRGWPLLYGRGETLGYLTILAPRSFFRAGLLRDLPTDLNSIAPTDDNTTYYKEYYHSERNAPEFAIFFRARPATSSLIGDDSDFPLKDNAGRHFDILEGIVIRGSENLTMDSLTQGIWKSYDTQVTPYFEKYWTSEKTTTTLVDVPMTFRLGAVAYDGTLSITTVEPEKVSVILDWDAPTKQELLEDEMREAEKQRRLNERMYSLAKNQTEPVPAPNRGNSRYSQLFTLIVILILLVLAAIGYVVFRTYVSGVMGRILL